MTFKPWALSGVALAALVSGSLAISGAALAAEIDTDMDAGANIDSGIDAGASVPGDAGMDAGMDTGADADAGASAADSSIGVGGDIDTGATAEATKDEEGMDAGADTTVGTGTDTTLDAAPDATATAPATAGAGMTASIEGTPVEELADAPQTLAEASVQSKDGASIGTVENVEVGDDGRPDQVKVSMGEAGTLGLAASDLSYDPNAKILVSQLTRAEIESLAAAQKQTH